MSIRRRTNDGTAGFTLVELLVVMLILGILMGFILVASYDSLRRAEERQTQATIVKLETALNDKIDSILSQSVTTTEAIKAMASVYVPPSGRVAKSGDKRALTIAQVDMLRAELPDVFFVQVAPNGLPTTTGSTMNFPLNFGAANNSFAFNGFPLQPGSFPTYPLGTAEPFNKGVFGASFAATAGIYKNLGLSPKGYDGVNNNPGSNFAIDEWEEGIIGLDAATVAQIKRRLANHTHNTARAEMLYALLVESTGPFGNVMSRDNFTEREIADTDGDGLPEFVDAWGEPLQFFRWPLAFTSDLQKGQAPYLTPYENRERDPLDPNQLLVSPAWWSNLANNNAKPSMQATVFQALFYSLREPTNTGGTPTNTNTQWWDRGRYYERRAYFSKPLIVSSGPDTDRGIFLLTDDYDSESAFRQACISTPDAVATRIIAAEGPAYPRVPPADEDFDAEFDDINNHNIQAVGGGVL